MGFEFRVSRSEFAELLRATARLLPTSFFSFAETCPPGRIPVPDCATTTSLPWFRVGSA